MQNKKRRRLILLAALLLAAGLAAFCLWPSPLPRQKPLSEQELSMRQTYVAAAEKWLGCNSLDGTHKPIIDIYNSHTPLAQGYSVKYDDAWCSTFVSAVAIRCGLTDIIPTECSCQRQIRLFQDLGCWEENDNYIPYPGDIIFYSTKGAKSRNNEGWSDHVGIVVSVEGNKITVIEGNNQNAVRYRTVKIGHRLIRGYGLPDFAFKC